MNISEKYRSLICLIVSMATETEGLIFKNSRHLTNEEIREFRENLYTASFQYQTACCTLIDELDRILN